jgi:hypothetical protein
MKREGGMGMEEGAGPGYLNPFQRGGFVLE